MTFLGTSYNMWSFLVEMSTLKQAIKLTFGRNKFFKRAVQKFTDQNTFFKKSRDQVDKTIDQFHVSKKYPQCMFQIHIMSRNL